MRFAIPMLILRRSLLLAAAMLAQGCDNPVSPRPAQPTRVHPDWVTGAAAAGVDPVSGFFVLSPPIDAELSPALARALAAGFLEFIKTDSPFSNVKAGAESDRGAPIAWNALEPCGRTFRSFSPIGPHPSFVPRVYHRLRASDWAVSFCSNGGVEFSVGVSDAPQSVALVDGQLAWDHIDSLKGVFTSAGVPRRFPSGLPLSPEDAVAFVFNLTRVRVVDVPAPFNQVSPTGIGHLPHCASWRLSLESPVSVVPVDGGAAELVSELFVRHEPACYASEIALYAAETPAPTSIWMHFLTGPPAAATIDSVLVDALGPTRFRRVQVVPSGGS